MTKLKRITQLGMFMMFLLVLASCGSNDNNDSSKNGDTSPADKVTTEQGAEIYESSGEPKYGGVFNVGYPANPETLDPHKSPNGWVHYPASLAYNKLVKFETSPEVKSHDMNIVPDLAEEWEISDDGLEYTFHLREAYFHDIEPVNGRQLDSGDVLATFERIQTMPGHQEGLLEYVESMEAPDDQTVVFTLSEPYAPFLDHMANHYMWILPKEGIDDEFDLNRTAIGTGPFMLEEWDNNVDLTYTRNPDFYEEDKPHLDGVRIVILTDPSTTLTSLKAGEIDTNTSTVSPEDFEEIKETNPELQTQKNMISAAPVTLYMNMEREPFDDLLVRKAINMSLDKEGSTQNIYGDGEVGGPINPTMEDFAIPIEEREELQPYDPEEAKKLLAEAGYPDGFDLKMQTTTMYGEQMVRMAQWVAEDLKEIGINVELETLEAGAYMENWTSKDYDIGIGFPMVALEPDESLSRLFHSEGSDNWFGIDDPKIDEMIEEQRMMIDEDERKEALSELQHYILENTANPIFISAPYTNQFLSERIRNFDMHIGFGWESMKDTWIEE